VSLLLEFRHVDTGCSVVIDDDGRVAWAYLKSPDEQILADVWLYNVAPTPEVSDWADPAQAPFLNPSALADPLPQPLPESPDDLTVQWVVDGQLLLADVLLRGVLVARLSPGATPGWNVLATIAGPCALPMPEAPVAPLDSHHGPE
jgi:hypothetical protein